MFDRQKQLAIANAYGDGVPLKVICEKYDCSKSTPKAIADKQGITRKKRVCSNFISAIPLSSLALE